MSPLPPTICMDKFPQKNSGNGLPENKQEHSSLSRPNSVNICYYLVNKSLGTFPLRIYFNESHFTDIQTGIPLMDVSENTWVLFSLQKASEPSRAARNSQGINTFNGVN